MRVGSHDSYHAWTASSKPIADASAVRVVDISTGGLHCAFDREGGTDPDQIPEG